MTKPLPVALHHTCFLVRDLEGTAQRLSDAFDIDPTRLPAPEAVIRPSA